MSQIVALPIDVLFDSQENAQQWLDNQSDEIKQTTYIKKNGTLAQKAAIHPNAYVDPTARLMGGMIINNGCYIGPYAVIRLDEKPDPRPLIIGDNSNIQDGAIVHSTTQHIGNRVIVAHQAIVHGAVIEDDVTMYIQSVADGGGTIIGKGAFLHQGSYVGKGIKIPPGRLVEPGQKVLTQKEADALGPVPPSLLDIRNHVLELNEKHNRTYLQINQ